jgi:hypothetical protein
MATQIVRILVRNANGKLLGSFEHNLDYPYGDTCHWTYRGRNFVGVFDKRQSPPILTLLANCSDECATGLPGWERAVHLLK